MPFKSRTMRGIMHELKMDNKKKGKARGQGGKPRSQKQMVAIALSELGKSRKK
jgi:hypothetical protein